MLLAQRHGIRGEQQVDALEREVHRQRDYDRLHAQDRDHQTGEKARHETGAENERHRDGAAEPVRSEPDDVHAVREHDERGDREVEPAPDDRGCARERRDRHRSRDRELVGEAEVPVVLDQRRDHQGGEQQRRERVRVVPGEVGELRRQRAHGAALGRGGRDGRLRHRPRSRRTRPRAARARPRCGRTP